MTLLISNASDRPIYEQIATQVKNAILSGELRPGQALPSIRALAKDLRVGLITTKRAYDELKKVGISTLRPAKVAMWLNRTPSGCGRASSPRLRSIWSRSSPWPWPLCP